MIDRFFAYKNVTGYWLVAEKGKGVISYGYTFHDEKHANLLVELCKLGWDPGTGTMKGSDAYWEKVAKLVG